MFKRTWKNKVAELGTPFVAVKERGKEGPGSHFCLFFVESFFFSPAGALKQEGGCLGGKGLASLKIYF
jgi:hypothetical protein